LLADPQWGSEDDDLYRRVRSNGFKITRPSQNVSRYTAISHQKCSPGDEVIRKHGQLLDGWFERSYSDGLSVSLVEKTVVWKNGLIVEK